MIKDKDQDKKLSWFFRKYMYPEKYRIGFIVLLILLGSSIGNLSPFLYGKMLDTITTFDVDSLVNLIIAYFLLTIGTGSLGIFENYIGQMLSFKIVKRSQKDLFNKIIRLRATSLEKYTSGELMSRLNGDCEDIVSFYLNVITSILHIAVNLAVSIYFVLTISVELSSVAIFYIPASLAVTFMARKRYRRLAEKRKLFGDSYFSHLNEMFSNNMGIKAFKLENVACQKFQGFISRERILMKNSILLSGIVQILNTSITVISSLFIIYLSGILIKDGVLTIGTMVAFNTYINKLFSSISEILNLNISKQQVNVSLERLTNIFSEKSEDEMEYNHELKDEPSSIQCHNISFRYSQNNDLALNNISFSLNNPGFYSFVGKNGCGKSTLAKILIKLYDIDSGYIEINGIHYRTCSIESLRENITYIQKEDFFLNDTIYNNLSIVNENVSRDDVYKACRIVGIDTFINSLPEKYETIVGEGGATLSSGQKQKLNIARALLKKSKIFIFDETTANLDGKAEKDIIEILKDISTHSFVLFISHKVSSIEQSDVIFLMEDGSIIDSGNHLQLLENNEAYQELFKHSSSFGVLSVSNI